MTSDRPKWYLALCRDCTPLLVMPFETARERAAWWTAHTDGTGHFVTVHDVPRVAAADLLTRQQERIAELEAERDKAHGYGRPQEDPTCSTPADKPLRTVIQEATRKWDASRPAGYEAAGGRP